MGKVGERYVYLVSVAIPEAVLTRIEVAGWRSAGNGKLFHAPFDRSLPGDGFFRRDRWQDDEAHGLIGAKRGRKWVLPNTVSASDNDGENRSAEPSRKIEGSGLKCDFDSEDRTLREQEDTFSVLDGRAGTAKKRAGRWSRTFGPDEEVPPASEMAAQKRERDELGPSNHGQRQG